MASPPRDRSLFDVRAFTVRGMAVLAMVAGLWIAAPGPAVAQQLRFVADEWCPYNCDPKSAFPGFMVEVARESLAPAGYEVRYEVTPWARAIVEAEQGAADGVIGADPEDAPNLVFPTVPMAETAFTLIVRRGEAFAYRRPTDIGARTVAIIRGYTYGTALDAWLEARRGRGVMISSGMEPLALNLRMVQSGRVGLTIEDRTVARATIAQNGLEQAFELIPTGDVYPIYIGLTPAKGHSPRIAALLDAGVIALRRSGRLAAILARYGLMDWE